MLILLAAATVAAAPAPAAPAERAADMPNAYTSSVPARCRDRPYAVVDRFGRPLPRRLGDLPASRGPILLVDRRIDGCPVITMMRGAPPPPDNPDPPPSAYRFLPLKPDKR
jgi:hypothetical protein